MPDPACKKRHHATDDMAGEVIECDGEGCDRRVVVPSPPEPLPVPPPEPEPVAGELIDAETGAVVKDWRDEVLPARRSRTGTRRPKPAERDRDGERDERPRRRRTGFRCPFCDTGDRPFVRQRVSSGGWVVFALLLVFFLPLFWVGLLMKEPFRVCSGCGVRLDR